MTSTQENILTDSVYENAEDGKKTGWVIYDKVPLGAIVTNTYDSAKGSNAIELTGQTKKNGFRLGHHAGRAGAWNNTNQTLISWDMCFSTDFNIYITVETEFGQRYLTYRPISKDLGIRGSKRNYIHHGIGQSILDGEWHTVQRNLVNDLADFEADNTIHSVNGFLVRGSGRLDNILLRTIDLAAPPAVSTTQNSFLEDEKITATVSNMLGDAEDWIAIFEQGAPVDYEHVLAWAWTDGIISGEVTLDHYIFDHFEGDTIPAGDYVVRAFFYDSYETEAYGNFSIISGDQPPLTISKASAFLSRATFGPTKDEIDALVASGDLESWVNDQFEKAASSHLQWIIDGCTTALEDNDWNDFVPQLDDARIDAWFDIVVNSEDQLRQRVAFALSEIFVVSKEGSLITFPDSLTHYYDVLVNGAFGNFRTLLSDITLHPMMGRYLTYLGNSKSDSSGIRPDENFAREIMQLFTIGLYELEQNGELKDGTEQATYTQEDVTELARVFTGWTDDNDFFLSSDGGHSHYTRTSPMIAWSDYHDTDEKTILGVIFEANQSAREDLDQALDLLFNHVNTGPFIARRLIQRLVTSNPSADYIERVAATFNDNGDGVRGDLQATIKAILLDTEALYGIDTYPDTFGKIREPLLFITNLWRAFSAQTGQHGLAPFQYQAFGFRDSGHQLQQRSHMSALTVFNYFTPDDSPTALENEGLVAPEMTVAGIDGLHGILVEYVHQTGEYETDELTAELSLNYELSLINNGDFQGLINHFNTLLTAGHMSSELNDVLLSHMSERQAAGLENERIVRDLIALVMASAEYAVQR